MSEDNRGIDAADDSSEQTERTGRSEARTRRRVKPVPVMLISLLLISGGAATWLYFKQYRPDKQTDASVASAVINSASDGTVALLSYSPDSLDKDFAAAKSHLSGDFLSYYNQFTEQIVAPAAKQKSLKTTASGVGGRGSRTASRLGRRAGAGRPEHHEQGQPRPRDGFQQRAGELDPGERQLADHQIRPGLATR